MGKIMAICTSDTHGKPKKNIHQANFAKGFGISGDIHGGRGERQVSILSAEQTEKYGEEHYGELRENLVIEGLEPEAWLVGSRVICNDVILEVVECGKPVSLEECPAGGADTHVIAKEGIFCKVVYGGIITEGDICYVE